LLKDRAKREKDNPPSDEISEDDRPFEENVYYTVLEGYGFTLSDSELFSALKKSIRRKGGEFKNKYDAFLIQRGHNDSGRRYFHRISLLIDFLYENLSSRRKHSKKYSSILRKLQIETKIRNPLIEIEYNQGIHVFIGRSGWICYLEDLDPDSDDQIIFRHTTKPKKRDVAIMKTLCSDATMMTLVSSHH
jgi:hypothetical protein